MVKNKSPEPRQAEAESSSLNFSGAPKGLERLFKLAQGELENEACMHAADNGPNVTAKQQRITLDELETFSEFHQKRPNISENQLEWIYRHRHHNGFEKAFRKIGKLRYVVVPIFTAVLLGDDNEY